ncbi:undecaprenyl-diphosphatase [Pedobacter steynii]|uniref:Undecaprenyl-diphosphatase n=1 Tax=Pedobacter steynii TaxID=430522 RepID=A0A1H0AG42_9SPHI|nr:phosphatase PAP2 family protein [Pedobacter steynii]NQX41369.1 phosphatase PAP2 family protein [Pedobacter steynii]SDN32489.1 undecaprenyl-diphosphatase [Pedobacter steynii]
MRTRRIVFIKYILLFQLSLSFALPAHVFGQNAMQRLDDKILINLSEHRTEQKTGFFMFLSKHNDVVNIGVPVALLAGGVITNDKEMRQNALYVASASAVNVLATLFLKKVIKRPRPFNGLVKINAVYQPSHYSFPSGHTSTAFTTATALSHAYPKWYVIAPAYLWAGSVGFSRLYLGVHYPTDVAAGALLGTGSAFSMGFIRPNK